MAGLDEIRSRLNEAKSDLDQARERRQRSKAQQPLPHGERRNGSAADVEIERRRRSELEAALEKTVAELEGTRSRLEGELIRAEAELKDAWAAAAAQPGRKAGKADRRIPELERQLAAERERREDLELAVELLQKQQAEDARRVIELEGKARASGPRAPEKQRVIPTPQAEPGAGRPVDPPLKQTGIDPEDGWGVSLEAFPLVDDEPQIKQTRASAGTGGARSRSLFRRRRAR